MKYPFLSVCIPTYNRKAYLSLALESLLCQLHEIDKNSVEVVISDNASTDGTEEMIHKLQSKYIDSQLKYFRQVENIGGIANFWFVAQAANGEYVYLLSDDDILLPGALKKTILMIQAHPDLDAICPKVSGFSTFPENVEPKILGNDDLVMDRNQALIRLGTMLTFMSSVVFRKDAIRDVRAKHDALFPHSFMFLDLIAREKGCLFLSQECLAARANETVDYDLIQAFVTDFLAVLRYAQQIGYSHQAIKSVLSAHAFWLAAVIYKFKKTSYSPTFQRRVRDSLIVLAVWWNNPFALLRVEAAIWFPLLPLRKMVRRSFIFK